jgi:hypothetical protein
MIFTGAIFSEFLLVLNSDMSGELLHESQSLLFSKLLHGFHSNVSASS